MKRAVGPARRAQRREAILDTAAETFDRLGFADTSMDWLAERAGLAKGTLYLYFPTKEAVFLALYRRELDAWFDAVDAGLDEAASAAACAGLVTDALAARPRLPALAAFLHTVLERNVEEEAVRAFRLDLLEKMTATGRRLEERLRFLEADDGARLLLRVHALVIGCWHAASPAPMARRLLEHEEFAPLRVDFHEEFEDLLVLLLEGWRQGGGGFR